MPVSDKLSEQVISLPVHPYLQTSDQDHVIEVIRSAVR